jgi:hypothetical protein
MRHTAAMNPRILVALAVLSHHAYAWDAAACGPTPYLLSPLLPEPGAQNVPVDAALIASSNMTHATFELREYADGAANAVDAGADIALETECFPGEGGGAVCVARPVEPLEPVTTYEWSAAMVPPGGIDPSYLQPSPAVTFTTAEAPTEATLPEIDVRVVSHQIITDAMCVSGRVVTLQFSSDEPSPMVLNIEGVTPGYVTQAVALTEASNPVAMTLYSAPECFTIETFDERGTRTPLRELCPESELPATMPTPTVQPVPDGPIEPPLPSTAVDPIAPNAPGGEPEAPPPGDSSDDEVDDDRDGVAKAPVAEGSSTEGCNVGPTRGGSRGWALGFVVGLALCRRGRRPVSPSSPPAPRARLRAA